MSTIAACIKRRVSVRTFEPIALSSEQKDLIAGILITNSSGPFGTPVRLELVDIGGANRVESKKYGTFGFVRGASSFMAGVAKNAEKGFLDFGYCFEKAVLELTDQNFGTCWMALTYNAEGFKERINLRADEALMIVSPIGVPSGKRAIVDLLIKAIARPRRRKPWDRLFFLDTIGASLSKASAGSYAQALECVRLAPSAVNLQPWRIVKDSARNSFHFFMKKKGSRTASELHAGIAMCHFGLATAELGLKGVWKVLDGMESPEGTHYCVSWDGE